MSVGHGVRGSGPVSQVGSTCKPADCHPNSSVVCCPRQNDTTWDFRGFVKGAALSA